MPCDATGWHISTPWSMQTSSQPTCPVVCVNPVRYNFQHQQEEARCLEPVASVTQAAPLPPESFYQSAMQAMTDQPPEIQDFLQRLQDRRARRRPEDISSRTPMTISTHFNAADNIERQLRADGHTIWGFVVYRCSYGNDDDWATVVRRLNRSIQSAMDTYNGHDMLENWRLTVFNDKESFDRASTQAVREHFNQWSAIAVEAEQGSREVIEARLKVPDPWSGSLALRYRFCIQVDEASLQSIVSEGEPGPIVSKGWVNLIKADWMSRAEDPAIEDEEFYEDADETFASIEGCTDEDVGWMRVHIQSVMPDFYVLLRDVNAWISERRRPPTVATA